MVREIVRNEEQLKGRSRKATGKDAAIADDLRDTLKANASRCVGMAANMIGEKVRIIVYADGGRICEMFNPEITDREGLYLTEEGCLSLEGMRKCARFRRIKVRWQSRDMRVYAAVFEDYAAEIIQHEIDHLNGIVI